MSEKHYNAQYLEQTGLFLKNLKESSYKPFAETKSGTIIDLGCGTGIDVIRMADSMGLSVVGLDHDESLLEKGRLNATGKENVKFICAEADQIPFEDNSISGVRAERLVQHLKNPEHVLLEVKRVLTENSPVVIVETDWAGLIFYNENVETQQKIVNYLTRDKINNGFASRKLVNYLQQCGFRETKIEVFPFVLQSLKEANDYLWIELIVKETLEKGIISKGEHDNFINSLRNNDEQNCFACSINITIVTSIK